MADGNNTATTSSQDPQNPVVGDLHIDATPLAGILRDLPPKATQGMRRSQEGIEEVCGEIEANQATLGQQIGILEKTTSRIGELRTQLGALFRYEAPIAKLAEMFLETRAALEDELESLVRKVGKMVDAHIEEEKDAQAEASYEKTRTYRSAIAMKGVKTRQKGEAAGGEG